MRNIIRLSPLLLCLATACDPGYSTNLADIHGRKVTVAGIQDPRGSFLSVMLDYDHVTDPNAIDGCASIDAEATVNGHAMNLDPGGTQQNSFGDTVCGKPLFTLSSLPPGEGVIDIQDSTDKIHIWLPDLGDQRSVDASWSFGPELYPGQTIELVPHAALNDRVREINVRAGTAACTEPVFEGGSGPTQAGFEYSVPNLDVGSATTGCAAHLTNNIPVDVTLDFTLAVSPGVGLCEGAEKCSASVDATTSIHATFMP